jgi:hypothetical protein
MFSFFFVSFQPDSNGANKVADKQSKALFFSNTESFITGQGFPLQRFLMRLYRPPRLLKNDEACFCFPFCYFGLSTQSEPFANPDDWTLQRLRHQTHLPSYLL